MIRVLPEAAPSAAEAARQLGCPVGAIANSMAFDAAGQPLLVLVSGAHRADVKILRSHLGGTKVKRASADFVRDTTGQDVGGVAPVGHPQPIPAIVDEHLTAFDRVWAGAGTESSLFYATVDELLSITGGRLIAVASTAPGQRA